MPALVMPCECLHQFQDNHYGLGKRVHNQCGELAAGGWRCTVCGKQKSSPKKEIKKEAEK